MKGRSLFVSYSAADAFAPAVVTRLEAQPISVWNYQRRDDAIRPTGSIADECKRHIGGADTFAALISPALFQSRWAALEVEHALARQRTGALAIFPLIGSGVGASNTWPDPFRELGDFVGSNVDFGARASIESAIAKVTRHLGADYQPPHVEDPRLPFMDRFFEELLGRRGAGAYANETYERLLRIAVEFLDDFEAGAYDRAAARIDYFIDVIEHEHTARDFCYPYIVRAVCDGVRGLYEEALERLEKLRHTAAAQLAGSPVRAAAVAASIGYVHYQEGRFTEAVQRFEEAMALSPGDPADDCNVTLARLYAGLPVDLGQAFAAIDRYPTVAGGDAAGIAVMKAEACALVGSLDDAERRYRAVVVTGAERPEYVVGLGRLLWTRDRPGEAVTLLEEAVRAHPDAADPRLLLARILCEALHARVEAIAHFSALRDRHPRDWMMQFQAMRGLWLSGARGEASRLARAILAPGALELPRTREQFFVAGAASWILGQHARAEHDFERSRKEPHWRYADYLT